jgi:aldose 1-epimerase
LQNEHSRRDRAGEARAMDKPESDQAVAIRSGPLTAAIMPSAGGCVAHFDALIGSTRYAILRASDGLPFSAGGSGCFAMVPYCNRIRDGRFTFRGRDIGGGGSLPVQPSPLHGQGWRACWQVESQPADKVLLVYRHSGGDWPWRYEARQAFTIEPDALSIRLTCRNLAEDAMPCGLGLHPFFPCSAETRVDAGVGSVWTIDDMVLPVERVGATGQYDLRERRICGADLDNCFEGWDGVVRIDTPDRPFRIELSSSDAHFLQLYAPPGRGFFAAEPVSHAAAALNRPELEWDRLGIRILEPGEEMAIHMRIALIARS